MENGDNHVRTAHKETLEEAGIHISLLGVLHIQSSISKYGARQRVIFYAVPSDSSQTPKSVPDEESLSARWMSIDELERLSHIPPPDGLRGDELLTYARYIEAGGPIYPLSLLAMSEHDRPVVPTEEERQRMIHGPIRNNKKS